MVKKALIIVGLAVTVAAVSGVALSVGNNTAHPRGADSDPTVAIVQTDNGGESDGELAEVGQSIEETSADTEAPSADAAESSQTSGEEISEETQGDVHEPDDERPNVITAEYGVARVIDRETGEEQAPRLLFGQYVNECYLKMFDDCTVEICLSPGNGERSSGTYSVYGDTMYVDFHDDRIVEYQVIHNDENMIESIIVPYGEFYVYFG